LIYGIEHGKGNALHESQLPCHIEWVIRLTRAVIASLHMIDRSPIENEDP
jgi:hypothetical protein